MIVSAVVHMRTNTSETSTLTEVPLTPLAGAPPHTSMKVPPLSSASTETATDLAPAMSASTPAAVPPKAVPISWAPTGLFTSAVVSHTSMYGLKPKKTTSVKATNIFGVA